MWYVITFLPIWLDKNFETRQFKKFLRIPILFHKILTMYYFNNCKGFKIFKFITMRYSIQSNKKIWVKLRSSSMHRTVPAKKCARVKTVGGCTGGLLRSGRHHHTGRKKTHSTCEHSSPVCPAALPAGQTPLMFSPPDRSYVNFYWFGGLIGCSERQLV